MLNVSYIIQLYQSWEVHSESKIIWLGVSRTVTSCIRNNTNLLDRQDSSLDANRTMKTQHCETVSIWTLTRIAVIQTTHHNTRNKWIYHVHMSRGLMAVLYQKTNWVPTNTHCCGWMNNARTSPALGPLTSPLCCHMWDTPDGVWFFNQPHYK